MALHVLSIALTITVLFTGCQDDHSDHSQSDQEWQELVERSKPVSGDALSRLFDESPDLVFRSFNGKWIGSDNDTEFVFRPDGRVTLVEYDVALFKYEGEYKIDQQGELVIKMYDYEFGPPNLLLRNDGVSLFLIPSHGGLDFSEDSDPPEEVIAQIGRYWPFRAVQRDEPIEPVVDQLEHRFDIRPTVDPEIKLPSFGK